MTTRATAPSSTFGEPIRSGYVLLQHESLVNMTSLEHKRWKRAHPEVCRTMGIR